jgi:hypothetical protein
MPTRVRKTSTASYNGKHDAAYRFERGVDPGVTVRRFYVSHDLIKSLADEGSERWWAGTLVQLPSAIESQWAIGERNSGEH